MLPIAALLLFTLPLGAQDTPPTIIFATNTPSVAATPTPAPTQPPAATTDEDDGYVRSNKLGITFIGSDDIPYSAERYERALELGAGWNRFPLYWDRVEPEQGTFKWDRYDEAVQRDVDHGLHTDLILLGGIPSFWRQDEFGRITGLNEPLFADGTSTPGTPDNPKAPNPDNGWAVFVHETVSRYMPGGVLAQQNGWAPDEGVTVWEIWNEPDFEAFWTAGIPNYARLLKVAYIITHQLDEDATVMFGGLAYTNDINWLAQVMAIYLNDPQHEEFNWYMDAVAVHNYGSSWRSGWLVLFAKRTFAEYGVDKPVWLNESGLPAWDDYPGPTWAADQPNLRQLRGTQAQQAAFFIQSTAWAYAEGAEVVFYHQLYDDCGDQPAGSNFPPHDGDICDIEGGGVCYGDAFGIYRNNPGGVCFSQHPEPDTARPVAESYKLVAEIFGEIPFSSRGAAVENFDAGVTTIAFVRAERNERVVVVWNTELEDTTFQLTALGTEAQLISVDEERTITAADGAYTLELPGGEPDNNPYAREWEQTTVGGMPVILIERVNEATAEQFLLDTGAIAPATAPEPTSLPGSNLADDDIDALIDDSPTGVVFVSLNISRIRNRPDTTSASRVLGNINPGQAATVVGRTPDDAWLLLDFNDNEVWVAAFLGERYGDDASVAALRTVPYPAEPDPTEPPAETVTEPTAEPTAAQ